MTTVDQTLGGVRERLDTAPGGAVVLERIARGGGATRWFVCHDRGALDAIAARLSPGSVVSFYFDDRIDERRFEPGLRSEVERIVRETGEAILAQLGPDSLELEIEYVTALSEFDEYAETLGSDSTLFVGTFPARDNDGVNAITVTIPDRDGVVRAHPH